MQLAENTVTGWSGVLADLAQKQQAAKDHLNQLRKQKAELSLEAALGSADAKKKLDRINSELGRLVLEADDFDSAIHQAEQSRVKAAQAEAETAERVRQEELSTLATAAARHAAEFTAALSQAVKAGAACKLTVQNMLTRATPEESTAWNQLLGSGPYMRAAEHAGLRAHLEFESYRGLKEHVAPLEETLAAYLERWIKKEGDANGK